MLDRVINAASVDVSTLHEVHHDCVEPVCSAVFNHNDSLSSRPVFLGLSLTFAAFT